MHLIPLTATGSVLDGMSEHPRTALELHDWFPTKQACRDYLARLRWPGGVRCPDCGASGVWSMTPPFYRCAQCSDDFTVTAGTLFADPHKPRRLWFEALWYVTNQKSGASALGVQRVLGLGSYRTAWNWMHQRRRAMVRPGRDRLVGMVEVEETFSGGPRPGKRGRGAAGKTLVLIAAQADGRKTGRIRLLRIADAAAASLESAVRQAIEPGTPVHTDDWSGDNGLSALGYHHEVIHPAAELGDNLLPRVNPVASLLKRWRLGTPQGAVRPSHLDSYLDEFTFRFHRRTSGARGLRFRRLLEQAVALPPVTGRDLVGGRSLTTPQSTTDGG